MHGNRQKSGEDDTSLGPLLAVVDLGTNNCRLLIAAPVQTRDGGTLGFRVIDSFSRIVRLGEGVNQTGALCEAAMTRTVAALRVCADRIAKHKVAHVRAIATQAARLAGNTAELVARVRSQTGLQLEVISAEEEADLAAEGCTPLIGRRYKGALVFDIGGGSTEVILLQKGPRGPEKKLAASVPVGVVSLAESYGPSSTSRSGFDRMQADLKARFAPFANQMGHTFDSEHYHLLGTSGTVTTLAAIALKLPRYNRTRVDGSWHETAHMLRVVERLLGQDTAALAKIGSIGAERADLMLPGCAIFCAICSLWPAPVLRVADRGLREGMLRRLDRTLI
ncbi:MAG TPA: Ppx/GppA phosphatase family protein [Rhizomicrobium sp.]|nr:Ppx/GppA phosphatase family protein [Rhizomicrobium sp.]